MDVPLYYKELFINSTSNGLDKCLDFVHSIEKEFNFSFEKRFALYTVVIEAVENAIIHGNKNCQELYVRILISISLDQILVEVEDQGDGFDIKNIPIPDDNFQKFNECGRGIFIIKNLSLNCYTIDKGNIIRIILER
jgi:serine/threonine-protein kinase RsbW